ncbi:MAG: serine/threonine protein kinase, partial [Deltaproteobacteria bacterium]|nr:serine/threonine protein kinase [Deltaproteobacteria bacterium]
MLEPNKWEVIADRYRLTRELARGGMGSVWAGQDKKLRRNVAVKLVAPTWDGASEAREQFEREAMAVAQLQSPHIVQVYDFGVERECPYIVMELLEGEDLRTRLHQVKRVTLETAAQILVQTAKALSVAHAVGIIHRDLKPGNIFLVRANEEELVKVLDFGVAKQVQTEDLLKAERGTEPVMGTPQFMSPEQARGLANIDHRTDLWALGVIIYRALTGHLPFHAATPTEVIVKVCTEDPRKVSELAPDLPAELDEFFARALARDPNQRFETARQMTLAFSRISPVTFTTLSMPDPDPAIEEAIRLARAAAGTDVLDDDDDDDDAATVAFDGQAAQQLADDIDDAKVRPKTGEPVPRTLRGQGRPLPAPTPPPRRSHPGPPPPRRPPGQAPPPPGERVPPTTPFQRVHSAPPIQPAVPPA